MAKVTPQRHTTRNVGRLLLALREIATLGVFKPSKDTRHPLFVALLLMMAAIAAIAILAYRSQEAALRQDTQEDLRA